MRKLRILLGILTLVSITLTVFAIVSPVLAIISQPDTSPNIYFLHVNRNLLTTGDIAVTGEYNIPYTSIPTVNADQCFYIRVIDTDGVTEIGSITPFIYFTNGYGHGAFMLYFSSGFVWGTSYTMRISENPTQFTTPQNFDYTINAADYFTASSSQEDNQADLASQVLKIATDMQTHYPTYTFTQSIPGRTVLAAPTGETYFSNAMPGLQAMSPNLFLIQVSIPDTTSDNWSTAQAETYMGRFDGTYVGSAVNATATQFHITPAMVTGFIFTLPLCIGAIIVSSRKFQRAESGFIFCLIAVILSFIMGWIPAAIFATLYQMCGIYIGYLWFYARG
jgi:hypothetical protein